jgi:preprotein translocase subunit SecD
MSTILRLLVVSLACLGLASCQWFKDQFEPGPLFELHAVGDNIRPLQIARVVKAPTERSVRTPWGQATNPDDQWLHLEFPEAMKDLPVAEVVVERDLREDRYALFIRLEDSERERLRRFSRAAVGERTALLVDGQVVSVAFVLGVMSEASFVITGVDDTSELLRIAELFRYDPTPATADRQD